MSRSVSSCWEGQEPKHISIPLHDHIPKESTLQSSFVGLFHSHIITGAGAKILVYSLDGRFIHSLEGHQEPILAVDVYQDTLVSSSTDKTVRIWNLIDGECLRIFTGTGDAFFACIAKPELVEIEQNGTFTKESRPKKPLIVMSDFLGSTLRILRLPYSGVHGSMATDAVREYGSIQNGFCSFSMPGDQRRFIF